MTKKRAVSQGAPARGEGDDESQAARFSSLFVEDDEYCIASAPFDPSPGLSGLTPAEIEVAQMAVNGFSNREIAGARGSSVRTVANQMAAVLQKLGAASRVQIASRLAEAKTRTDPANQRSAP